MPNFSDKGLIRAGMVVFFTIFSEPGKVSGT